MNNTEIFNYVDERFADIQMLRYRLKDFESLTAKQKTLIYYLSEATLWGRDITCDQYCRYNIAIRKLLECVYLNYKGDCDTDDFRNFATYLHQVWFANGIHHHYGCEKFKPEFSVFFLTDAVYSIDPTLLPLAEGQTVKELCDELFPVIFDPAILAKRVNKDQNADLLLTSACNYYQDVTQQEAEEYYEKMRQDYSNSLPLEDRDAVPSFGLNSTLVKDAEGQLHEEVWSTEGKYSEAIKHIIYWLEKALEVCENDQQHLVITLLIKYYLTGDLAVFDEYSIEWLREQEGRVDFINGFIEVYGDPLGIKGTWEAIVEYKDMQATKRTQTISQNAQWFEDNSPVDPRFRKPKVTGVTANVICAAMLGGEEYPSSAIGINLPNADWIRAQYGSKSVTIGNLTEAYDKAAKGNGFLEEFVVDDATRCMIREYGDKCDDLHTDLHECLGHGSGQLLPGVDANALKSYGSAIEEARADLFGLYYIADPKLVELGLLPDLEAHHSQYYTYMMNGLLTQCVRIKLGDQIEEAHMRNRALIARWVLEHADGAVELLTLPREGSEATFLRINDYTRLRQLFATLLAEIQRIKSEGDYEAAKYLIETYAVHLDRPLHEEMLQRYKVLNIAPYKGFINPRLTPVKDADGNITDVAVDYTESFTQQMLRYGKEYSTL